MEDNQIAFVLGTLLLGGVLAFMGYYLASSKRRKILAAKRRSETTSKNVTESYEKKPSEQREVTGPPAGGSSNSKRQAKSKKRREAQQEFSHSWMVGALKGHTAPVLDMDFSANGKYLASCAEDCGLKADVSAKPSISPVASNVGSGSSSSSRAGKAATAASSSGRASPGCARADSGVDTATPPSPSSSSSSGSPAKEEHQRAILSRRQRKNRTRFEQRRELRERDEDHDEEPPTIKPSKPSKEEKPKQQSAAQKSHHHHHHKASVEQKSGQAKLLDAEQHKKSKLQLSAQPVVSSSAVYKPPRHLDEVDEASLVGLLRRYTLTGDQLNHLGYPVEMSHFPGLVVVAYHQQHPSSQRKHNHHHAYARSIKQQHHLDANAREFVPGRARLWGLVSSHHQELDSGNGSASSSVESSDLEQESSSDSDKSSDVGEASDCQQQEEELLRKRLASSIERRCVRCSRSFYVGYEDGEYLYEEKCCYHWGKLRSGLAGSSESWECCRGRETSRGCTQAKAHVWTGVVPGYNGPFHDYEKTRPSRLKRLDNNYGVYALDCEMCFTKRGLELGKVTVVGLDGRIVYEALCKPDAEVIDYNTRFSGLRAKDLGHATKSLRDVQKDIMRFVSAETILIGHGLENDLRALRLIHPTVVDTCVAYPHFLGYPYRSSLKTLARTVLKKEIQVKEHDSAEDARIAVDLMLKRVQHDFF